MKIIITILLILPTFALISQDKEPNNWEFRWGHSNSMRTFDLDSFQQERVQTGFQWGGSTKMNNALYNNVWTGNNYTPTVEVPNLKANLIFQPTWDGGSDYLPAYFGAVMMQYEPTLPLDGTNEGEILRPNDTTDPVFGFRYRRGTISTNPSDENYSRIVLKTADKPSYGGDRVLEDIWPQPRFETREWGEKNGQSDNYLGRKWYLAINLRRLNPSTEIIKDDSVVIKIKMPITYWDNVTDNIRFNKVPINHQDSVEKLHFIDNPDSAAYYSFIDSRGYAQLMQVDTTETIEITRRMIPTSTDSSENITIYAEFHTNGEKDSANAKFAQEDEFLGNIKDFDIEVDYFGGLDVAIDYIRVEEFNAHLMMRGEVDWIESDYTDHNGVGYVRTHPSDSDYGWREFIDDSGNVVTEYTELYGQHYPIYNIIQSSIDELKAETDDWEKARIFRFGFQDTEVYYYYWWGALRYCNKLSNGIFMTRDNIINPKLYQYYTKSPNKWLGGEFGDNDKYMAAPYARNADQRPRTMGLRNGFINTHRALKFSDSLSSDYEMRIDSTFLTMDSLHESDSWYFFYIYNSHQLQPKFEAALYNLYYNGKKSSFLYNNSEWYKYHLLYNIMLVYDDDYDKTLPKISYYRHKTAEELRLLNFSALIRGCKGFISDGDNNRRFPDVGAGSPGVGDNSFLNEYNDIYSDSVGTDYIDTVHSTWDIYKYADLELHSQHMQVPKDKIYIGTKSYRSELFELNSLIRANDELLMNFSLAATMSKGYRSHYSQNDDIYGSDTLLSKFVNFNDSNETYTSRLQKSIFDVKLDEPYDSTFYDFTLLKEENVSLDSIFYIGVQNRRTDPLIYWTNPDNPSQKYLRFLSSAEFRDSCMNSPDSLLYQDYWWKRLGARKVTIPFNYTYSDTNTYNLLRVSEIGSDVDSLNQLWHRGEKYYDMVTDTVIGENRSLSFNLLPGQGKILKVEVLKPDTVAGFLDNYNFILILSNLKRIA